MSHGRHEARTRLAAPADAVWVRATTAAGIAEELRPLLRMTIPAALREGGIDAVTPGAPLGRAWLLLGGVLPVEADRMVVAEIGPGRRFLERSSMLALREWEHERRVHERGPDACEVHDRLRWRTRAGVVPGPLVGLLVGRLFLHRHARLRRRWGAG